MTNLVIYRKCESHAARIGAIAMHKNVDGKNVVGSDVLEDLDVDASIILNRILRKRVGMVRTQFIWLGVRNNNDNEFSSSVNIPIFHG
jgi:hypothetical protein